MRRKIFGVAVWAAAVAVTLLGLPLAFVAHKVVFYDEHRELDRVALRTALAAAANRPSAPEAGEEPGSIDRAVYAPDGRLLRGTGPARADAPVTAALAGGVIDRTSEGRLVVAVPVYAGDRVVAVARASSSRTSLEREVVTAWAAMAVLAALAGLAGVGFAARQSRRLAAPLVELEQMAEELGDGNFAVRAKPCGVEEIDRAGGALNRTAQRLDDILARERAFTAVASHQLRTPLTTLRLDLEQALSGPEIELRPAIAAALSGTDALSATVDDVLALARGTAVNAPMAIATLLAQIQDRWTRALAAQGRKLTVRLDDPPLTSASMSAVRQILDVLLDNAARHGRGTVTVIARAGVGALAVDVADEGTTAGTLLPERPRPDEEVPRRLGLGLAASLAAAQGGRLVHARTDPTTRLTVLLPDLG